MAKEIIKVPEPKTVDRPTGASTELPTAFVRQVEATLESGKALQLDFTGMTEKAIQKTRGRISSLARSGVLKFAMRTCRRGELLYVWAEKKSVQRQRAARVARSVRGQVESIDATLGVNPIASGIPE